MFPSQSCLKKVHPTLYPDFTERPKTSLINETATPAKGSTHHLTPAETTKTNEVD